MLDVISGGRLIAGFPVGSSMDTNFAYGEVPANLRDKYREAHDLIVQAWTRPDPFTFNGKYTQLRYVNIWPRPVQKPHPPVWVPGGGSIETWDWVIEHHYMYAYLSYFGYKRGKKVMDGYWEAVDRHNVEANPYRAGFLQLVAVSETDAKVEAEYAKHADYFYKFCLHVFDGFADAPGYRTMNTLKAGLRPQVGSAASRERQQLTWGEYLDNGYIIAGSPKTVRERLREAMQQMRVGHLMVLCQFGSMPPELAKQNSELFGTEVLPYIRDLWQEYEDHWWPKPLAVRAQPAAT
jgi:alkanesulfonate monooxygenase SsuD/methylene tetrahydromethanopterin reductase-like flavin-dependent oxidoreductase (luciferase family)